MDLRAPLPREMVSEIDAAMDRYAVLVFPGQDIDDDQQIAFGHLFGELEAETATVDVHECRLKMATPSSRICALPRCADEDRSSAI